VLSYIIIAESVFVISSGKFWIWTGGQMGMGRKFGGNRWGWKSNAVETDGDGNHV